MNLWVAVHDVERPYGSQRTVKMFRSDASWTSLVENKAALAKLLFIDFDPNDKDESFAVSQLDDAGIPRVLYAELINTTQEMKA